MSQTHASRSMLALVLAATMAVPSAAQQSPVPAPQAPVPQVVDFSKPQSHLPNVFGPYAPRQVSEPGFSNAPRLHQLVNDGKVLLSLNDAIALALENNLDLAIARYNLSIADTDVLRSKAGSTIRGVATGLVQGTPGGGIGGFGSGAGSGAGGTSVGSGGAGAGSSGLVQSTLGAGPSVPSFDPVLSSSLFINHSTFPLANTVTSGVANLRQNRGTADFSYSQGWATGTQMQLSFNNSRETTNSLRTTLIPVLNSSFNLQLRQPLLEGFGVASNTRFIRIARNNREISDIAFRNQVIATVSQIQNIYWDLVNAYEDVKVKERSVTLANKTLSDNRKQVDIGTLAPIEIVRAESEVATRNQELIVSQTNLQLQQLLMKNAITRNLGDAALAAAEVIPTDAMTLPENEPVIPTQDLIHEALSGRPELAQSRIDLTNRDINRKAARNSLLPSLDFVASYGGSGLAGEQNPNITCGSPNASAPPNCMPANSVPRTGYNNAFARLFDNSNPNYAFGLQLSIPIRNRAAQADQVRSELEYRQAQLRMQQLQNQIGIEVRNAQFAVQQNRARVEAARKGRELAQQSLEAEQKKYSLGASTNFQVLQAQRDLAQAESALVQAMSAYEKSRVELDRVTGQTLSRNSIRMDEAETGVIHTMPAVPYVAPRAEPITQR